MPSQCVTVPYLKLTRAGLRSQRTWRASPLRVRSAQRKRPTAQTDEPQLEVAIHRIARLRPCLQSIRRVRIA